MNHDIHGHPIKTTQRDDWWMPESRGWGWGRGRRRSRKRDGQETCLVCDCDIFDGYDPLPYCAECQEGYETIGEDGDDDRRRSGRLGHGDGTTVEREGMMENEVRAMEDGR